jgi:ribosomal protein L18
MNKKAARLRRSRKARAKISDLKMIRLCVFRTNNHIYAQIIDSNGANVLASASTVDKEIRNHIKSGGNVESASIVGKYIAERAKSAGIEQVAFDRSGFQYHGRIKALAESARDNGLRF